MLLNRTQILENDDSSYETVPVPEWGGSVVLRRMTSEERDDYESSITREVGKGKKRKVKMDRKRARATLLSRCIVVAAGDPTLMFTADDVEALSKKSAVATERLFNKAMEMQGFTEKDEEELLELGND